MNIPRIGKMVRLFLAAACIVMGVLSWSGVISSDVPNGRLIFGIGWILIGVGWLVRYYLGRSQKGGERSEGGRDDAGAS
jgi:hypothetical protein